MPETMTVNQVAILHCGKNLSYQEDPAKPDLPVSGLGGPVFFADRIVRRNFFDFFG